MVILKYIVLISVLGSFSSANAGAIANCDSDLFWVNLNKDNLATKESILTAIQTIADPQSSFEVIGAFNQFLSGPSLRFEFAPEPENIKTDIQNASKAITYLTTLKGIEVACESIDGPASF